MSRLLVTGATGFVGSAVCRVALEQGMHVWGLARAGKPGEPIEGVAYRVFSGDASDSLESTLREIAPDRIIHCAGATPRVISGAEGFYEGNVRLTWQLLGAMRAAVPRAHMVLVSSAAVYGAAAPSPVSEELQPAPGSHYGWSKLVAEDIVGAFVAQDGLNVSIARSFNLLGGEEPAGSLISDVITQLDAGACTVQLCEDSSVRDYLDVRDGAAALLLLSSEGRAGEAYNVCSGEGVSVAEMVRLVVEVWGSSAAIEVQGPPTVPSVSVGSSAKLAALGWRAHSDVRTALERLRAARYG